MLIRDFALPSHGYDDTWTHIQHGGHSAVAMVGVEDTVSAEVCADEWAVLRPESVRPEIST